MAKIKSSQIKTFMNTTPSTTASYDLIGDGVTESPINMNPKTTEEQYIHNDNASFSVDSYAPKMPVKQTAIAGDDVFEFINDLYQTRAILSDAETDICNVWLYETPAGGEYPAEKQTVVIAIDNVNRVGGSPISFDYTINFTGDPVAGTFNPTTSAFTPNP
jgi:hypothetical protein